MLNFIYGLGGRDLRLEDVREAFRTLAKAEDSRVEYIGLRE
jgi:pyruvate/2-oxoacid:ferredoxin oxidoreductase alpha subunit